MTIQRTSDGQQFTIALTTLSEGDQGFAKAEREKLKALESRPAKDAFLKYQDRFDRFRCDGKSFEPKYLGTMGMIERPIEVRWMAVVRSATTRPQAIGRV